MGEGMAPHSSTLAWKIPWTEEPGRLWSMGSRRVTWLNDFSFTFHFHALEKEMATHSSVLAWRIPGMVKPGGLPSMGLHSVRHDWSDLAAAPAPVADWTPSNLGVGPHLPVSNLFAFSYNPWVSSGKNTGVGCHFLLHWTVFCQNSSLWPLSWVAKHGMAYSFTVYVYVYIWEVQIWRYLKENKAKSGSSLTWYLCHLIWLIY